MAQALSVETLTVLWNAAITLDVGQHAAHLIGWPLSDTALLVCAAANPAWDPRDLKDYLKHTRHLSAGLARPDVIGCVGMTAEDARCVSDMGTETESAHGCMRVGIVLDGPQSAKKQMIGRPRVVEFVVDGRQVSFTSTQFLMYTEPDVRRGRFLTLTPLVLDLSRYDLTDLQSTASFSQLALAHPTMDAFRARISDLASTAELEIGTPAALPMDLVIDFINSSQTINEHLKRKSHGPQGRQGSRQFATAATACFRAARAHMRRLVYPFTFVTYVFLILANTLSTLLLAVLRVPLPFPGNPNLTDLSATCAQIELRVQQASFWHVHVTHLWDTGARELGKRIAEYINFNNTIWLIANDVILGVALGGFLATHADQVADFTDAILSKLLLAFPRSMAAWLMAWPAGLKLNAPLARFMGELFLWLLSVWDQLIALVRPHLVELVLFIASSGFFGLTMILALLSDLISLSSMHFSLFHRVAARIHAWQLAALSSLFLLFRGKKDNVLRKRVDAQDYGLDQLVVGTILLTTLVFLAPTVWSYHALFSVCRGGVVVLLTVVEGIAAAMNHFPLFALTLRIKDGARLPGGLRVQPVLNGEAGYLEISVGWLSADQGCFDNQSIALSRTFHCLWDRSSSRPRCYSRALASSTFIPRHCMQFWSGCQSRVSAGCDTCSCLKEGWMDRVTDAGLEDCWGLIDKTETLSENSMLVRR